MDQDVTEITFLPMDTQGLVVKYVCSGSVFSQNAEIRQEDFLTSWLLGWKLSTRGTFSDRWMLYSRSLCEELLHGLFP